MGTMRRSVVAAGVSALAIFAGCGGNDSTSEESSAAAAPGSEEVFELRYGDANPPSETSPMTKTANFFIERLEEYGEGRIEVTYFPNSELGPSAQMLSGVQSGSIDFANLTTGTLATVEPRFLLFSLPFLVADQADIYSIFASEAGQELLGSLEDQGVTGLVYNDNGPFIVLTKDQPVKTPEDMQGLKLRIIQDPASEAMLDELGAQAVALDFPEVYGALQQGVIDGAITSPGSVVGAQLNEVADHVSFVVPQWVAETLFVSNETMERLPPDLQEAVRKAAADTQANAEEQTADILEEESAAVAELGITVQSDVDVEPFRQRMRPVYDQLEGTVGAELIEQAQAAVEAP